MKTFKNVLTGMTLFILLFFLGKLIPDSKRRTGVTNYAPDGCTLTMKSKLNGIVTATKFPGLFYVILNNDSTIRYPIIVDDYQLPPNWRSYYPDDFVMVGDSISKASNTDTFFIYRNNKEWMYVLAGPFTK